MPSQMPGSEGKYFATWSFLPDDPGAAPGSGAHGCPGTTLGSRESKRHITSETKVYLLSLQTPKEL